MTTISARKESEHPPFKELEENTIQVRAIAPSDFHLRGRQMNQFLHHITEIAGMEEFTTPIALDPTNSEKSSFSAVHPLGGRKKAHDENGFIGWRNSFVTVCVYNGTRTEKGVQMTVTAHACGELPPEKLLRFIYSTARPAKMEWGRLSSTGGTLDFHDYELAGDDHFKAIVHLLWEKPKTKAEKMILGQRLDQEVLARKRLMKELALQGRIIEPLDKLLLKRELKKLQKIFGDYEGILEQGIASSIIRGKATLEDFPYFKRYDELTDTEIAGTEMESVRTVCMMGGGWLPISAFLYARKTNAHIYIVEKDTHRAKIATEVTRRLGLEDRIAILNQKAEDVDYSQMDVVVLAAMAEPKSAILEQASKTYFPRTIVLRAPLGDSQAFYPSLTLEELYGHITGQMHHIQTRYDITADSDGVFSLLYFDSERVVNLP